jgi:hypothetical protein
VNTGEIWAVQWKVAVYTDDLEEFINKNTSPMKTLQSARSVKLKVKNQEYNIQANEQDLKICQALPGIKVHSLPWNILRYYIIVGRPWFDPRQRQMIFRLASVSRPAVMPTQPPVEWVPEILPLG